MAQKLWMASVIQGHRNPFGKALTEYSVPELDFVLEMAARDEPERYIFKRAGAGQPLSKALASWHDVFAGELRQWYMLRTGLAQGLSNVVQWRRRQGGGLQPGISRGGKAIDGRVQGGG